MENGGANQNGNQPINPSRTKSSRSCPGTSAGLDRIETTMATKEDLQQLGERVASRMDGLDGRMDRLEVALKTTLEVVQSIDRNLAELAPLKTLP